MIRSLLGALASGLCLLLLDGCGSADTPPKVAVPSSGTPPVVVPAEIVGGHFIVTLKWNDSGPWRFLVDTGSTTTLVSPEFARRNNRGSRTPRDAAPVSVRSISGDTIPLKSVTLGVIELGDVRFKNTSALVYDCDELSAHFGQKIDGVLGFPLFRHVLLTLDYPKARIVLQSPADASSLPGNTVRFNNDRRVPFIPVELDGRPFAALVDSGSDGSLHLNPAGLHPAFANGPRPGGTVATLTGDHPMEVGRLAQNLTVGGTTFTQPVAELTDELSSLGGGLLKNFRLTFDQTRNQMTFYRENDAPVVTPSFRSTGISFKKLPAYWRVLGVVPGSPADENGVRTGDLVTRINGEPVSGWNLGRYDELVRTARRIEFTFLSGRAEMPVPIDTFALVP
ncbi:MAG: aspartyl protease family protein [Opitutaceae bacterium]|jgi:hypothetical protein